MKEFGPLEKLALIASVFLCAFGAGLLVDGKKLFRHQFEASARVDYKRTLNPY
jgi:hypothetical protein